jgi:hypothetical protein
VHRFPSELASASDSHVAKRTRLFQEIGVRRLKALRTFLRLFSRHSILVSLARTYSSTLFELHVSDIYLRIETSFPVNCFASQHPFLPRPAILHQLYPFLYRNQSLHLFHARMKSLSQWATSATISPQTMVCSSISLWRSIRKLIAQICNLGTSCASFRHVERYTG